MHSLVIKTPIQARAIERENCAFIYILVILVALGCVVCGVFTNERVAAMEVQNVPTTGGGGSTPTVWVFGYGSLCWYPGFEYTDCITGYIRGYVRRFWQGNVTHRGTKEKVRLVLYPSASDRCDPTSPLPLLSP